MNLKVCIKVLAHNMVITGGNRKENFIIQYLKLILSGNEEINSELLVGALAY